MKSIFFPCSNSNPISLKYFFFTVMALSMGLYVLKYIKNSKIIFS